MSIWDEIQEEREHQKSKWGGASHDDQHTTFDWVAILTKQVGRAVTPGDRNHFDIQAYRTCMVKVAATAVAAIEWCGRNIEEDNDASD